MLLQSRVRLERHCPRWWSLTAASGLISAAVLIAGLGLKVQANPDAPENKKKDEKPEAPRAQAPKEEPKPEKPLDPADFARELQKLLQDVDPAANPKEFEKRLQDLQERLQRDLRARMKIVGPGAGNVRPAPIAAPAPVPPPPVVWNVRSRHTVRLGIAGSAPDAVLAEQLDLPAGKGLVIDQVLPDSAAAKAGLKPHDILLQLNDKDVPNNLPDLARIVAEIKADTPVDAVVLRKGKKETIKGISLPEVKVDRQPLFGNRNAAPIAVPPGVQVFPGGAGVPNANPGVRFAPVAAPPEKGVMTSIFRTDNRFTTRHQEGSLVITVTGTVETGKSKLNEITIQDGGVTSKYERVDKVPEQYRDKVKNLIEMSAKSSIKIEIKTP